MARPRAFALPRIVVLLLIAWGLLIIRLNAPWFGVHDANGAWISSAVRNYYLYGPNELGFLQVTNPGPAAPDTYRYYTHHPPLVVWVSALTSVPFGFHEATMRLVSVSATVIGIAAFYSLNRRLTTPTRAWWGTVFYTFVPITLYYGRMPNHEPLTLAVCMIYTVVWVNWLRHPTRKRWITLSILAWIAVWTSWAAVLYVGALGIAGLWLGTTAQRRAMIGIGGITVLALATLLGFYQWQWPGALQDLVDVFIWRTSNQTFRRGSVAFTWGEFFVRQVQHLMLLITPSVLLLSVAGILPFIRDRSRQANGVLVAFFAVGVGYLLIFRNAAYIHNYYQFFLLPPLAMTASAAPISEWYAGRHRRWIRPALTGLLIVWLIANVYVVATYHLSGEDEWPQIVAQILKERTATDDLIMSNVPYISPALEFYAFRNIVWDVLPDAALTNAAEDTRYAIYLYCGQESALPDDLAAFPVDVEQGCMFIQLR